MTKTHRLLTALITFIIVILFLIQPGGSPDSQRAPDGNRAANNQAASTTTLQGPQVNADVIPSLSPAVRDLPPPDLDEILLDREVNPRFRFNPLFDPTFRSEGGPDPLLPIQANAPANMAAPTLLANFDGNVTGTSPHDPTGDIGANYYIQATNSGGGTLVNIIDKNTNISASTFTLDSLGSNQCANGLGDPIILYDHLAERWFLSEFSSGGNRLCVYISQSSDPLGSYYAYNFTAANSFPDYPKYGLWPDAYYLGTNESTSTVYALERADMLNGAAATTVHFNVPDMAGFGFQMIPPADLDGANPPRVGDPGYFMRHRDDEVHNAGSNNPSEDYLDLFAFAVDWATPGNATFTQIATIPVAEFDSDLCGLSSFNCFPQQGTSTTLDPLREVIMWRLQYRNFGNYETLVANHVTDVSGSDQGGLRWYELRRTNQGTWTLYQQGTYSPDSLNRFMGSIAMDGDGNIALAYSVTSSSMYPSLRYTGREAADPLGTMAAEVSIHNGTGTSGSNRWGDYSSLNIDPKDDCTFWYTMEYGSGGTRRTRIASFKFDSCGAQPNFSLSATPSTQDICAPNNANYTVALAALNGLTGNVNLTANGNPGSASFSPNPVTLDGNSTLTISGATSGNYTFDIIGTHALTPSLVQTDTVTLNVQNLPGTPSLTSPSNGATDISTVPTFSWTAVAGASNYTIEIATDVGFSNIIDSATVSTNSYTPSSALSTTTTYYWRVQASNSCGNGSTTSPFSFTTQDTPPTSLSCNGTAVDFESGIPADWTIITVNGTGWDTTDGGFCGSGAVDPGNFAGTGEAACADSDADGGLVDTYLCTPALDLTTAVSATLNFRVNYQVYLTPDANDFFQLLPSTSAPSGPYDPALLALNNDYPDGTAQEVPNSGASESISLNSYTGQTLYTCFRYGGDFDWYAHVDDVSLSCSGSPQIEVTPEQLVSSQPTDTSTNQTLTISNTGQAALTWSLSEAPAPVFPTSLASTTSSRDGNTDRTLPLANNNLLNFSQNFDDITNLPSWASQNNPDAAGLTTWFQGNTTVFNAHIGANDAYIGANFNNTGGSQISNWLMTPEVNFSGGSQLTFWTRTASGSNFPDRLQIRVSTNGSSTDVGSSPSSVGDFTNLDLDINASLTIGGYPEAWTQYLVDLSAYAGQSGRVAFRYYIPANAGPSGSNSNYIGIDTVEFIETMSVCDTPSDLTWLSVSPTSGSTPIASSDAINITFNSNSLAQGDYNGSLCVDSNDPLTPRLILPLTLTVSAESPTIQVAPTSLSVIQASNSQISQTLTISNVGTTALNWTLTEDNTGNSANPVRFLTGPNQGTPLAIAQTYIREHLPELGLTTADINNMIIRDQYTSEQSGLTHIFFRQQYNGLEVHQADIHINIGRNGRILNLHNTFIPNLAGQISNDRAVLSAAQAIQAAANHLGLLITQPLTLQESNANGQLRLSNGGISRQDIPARLLYQPGKEGVHLAWHLEIDERIQPNYWSIRVDAATGAILAQDNHVIHEDFRQQVHQAHGTHLDILATPSLASTPPLITTQASLAPDDYRVFHMPVESPIHNPQGPAGPPDEGRTLESNPADATASPFGWHDTNGVAGAEYTITRGNNVHAYEDGNNSGFSPDCGGSLICDFALDLSQTPDNYEAAAITNLFHWNNLIHDVWYQYGFDEPAGNMQANNYGNGGVAGDAVNAEAQDGSGTCNANMLTLPDGTPPRMQMYICGSRDGDLDNGVIAHEYWHSISLRLTGGPGTTSCLNNNEQAGEGWSDWGALMMTIEAGDQGSDARGIGTYLIGEPANGPGIRPQPYSTNMAINNFTYADVNSQAVPHGVGWGWATIIWDVTWALIDNGVTQSGFDPNFYTGTGGNNLAMQLIIDGLKLQPCNPTFVEARDAILLADQNNNSGANQCVLWEAFARRGLGINASDGGAGLGGEVEDFNIPAACLATLKLNKSSSPNPVASGSTLTYTLHLQNDSLNLLTGVTLSDTIQANQTYLSNSATCGGTESNGLLTFPLGTLTAGQGLTCTFQVTIDNGLSAATYFTDDIESGPSAWTPSATNFTWSIDNSNPHSGANAWFAQDVSQVTDQTVEMANGVTIGSNTTLRFWHHYDTEAGYDGGVVEISANNGPWTDLGALMTQNGYNDTISTSYSNPLGGRAAFAGDSGSYLQTIVDLSSYAGNNIRVRFRLGTDSSVAGNGWFIDDISIGQQLAVNNRACVSTNEGDNVCGETTTTILEVPFVPACSSASDIPWLTVSANNGTINPSNSTALNVLFDATGMSPGTHTANLCISSNDPITPMQPVPVAMTVCNTPTAVTDLNLSTNGSTTQLQWSHTGASYYQVWWADSAPYFLPGNDCNTAPNCAIANSNSYDHIGGPGNANTNYTYTILAVNTCGSGHITAVMSNRSAEFDYTLSAGD